MVQEPFWCQNNNFNALNRHGFSKLRLNDGVPSLGWDVFDWFPIEHNFVITSKTPLFFKCSTLLSLTNNTTAQFSLRKQMIPNLKGALILFLDRNHSVRLGGDPVVTHWAPNCSSAIWRLRQLNLLVCCQLQYEIKIFLIHLGTMIVLSQLKMSSTVHSKINWLYMLCWHNLLYWGLETINGANFKRCWSCQVFLNSTFQQHSSSKCFTS